MKVKVIGAGLAGCEAAYQLAKRGYEVELFVVLHHPFHQTDVNRKSYVPLQN